MNKTWMGNAIPCKTTGGHDWRPDPYNDEWRNCTECGARQRSPSESAPVHVLRTEHFTARFVPQDRPAPKAVSQLIEKLRSERDAAVEDRKALEDACEKLAQRIECDPADLFKAVVFELERRNIIIDELRGEVGRVSEALTEERTHQAGARFRLHVGYNIALIGVVVAWIVVIKFAFWLF